MAELILPELGENITQGTVTKILVKNGDAVKKRQNILELETDKAVLEVPSSSDGVIAEVLIKNGARQGSMPIACVALNARPMNSGR